MTSQPTTQASPNAQSRETGSVQSDQLRTWARRIHTTALILGAVALFAFQAPKFDGAVPLFLILLGLHVAAEYWKISIYGASFISVGLATAMAIIILFGAPGAVIAAPLAAVAGWRGRGRVSLILLMNASLLILADGVAGLAYNAIAPVNPDNAELIMVAGAMLASLTSFSVTAANLPLGIFLRTGERPKDFWEKHRWLIPHYVALGVVGLALASAYLALGYAGILAFLTPALMMQLSIKQYVDKTADNVTRLEKQNAALEIANVEIREVSEELKVSYDSTLEALVSALDARDQETKGHSVRVASYMLDIARAFGVPEGTKEWIDMQRGALLHDVGKIGVSDTILLKPGKLTDDEWTWMRKHPEIGYNMLKDVGFLKGASEIILAHHERWDGKGYPRGLAGDDVPLGARIFMVCDTFDSMTSDRPYRKAMETQAALNEVLKHAGAQFDPRVVEAFLDIYETWVKEREELHKDDVPVLRAAA